jgi:DNA-3-methyladenine glycosylase
VVTDRAEWANGVLLRALALPGEPERVAAGPGLLARRFGLDRRHNALAARVDQGLWLAPQPARLQDRMEQWSEEGRQPVMATTRIGIREGQDLPWRWYLTPSRSVSRRARGDGTPRRERAWWPEEASQP